MPLISLAGKKIEINQITCNLPMKEIRRLLPDKDQQRTMLSQCMKKASEQKWRQNTLLFITN